MLRRLWDYLSNPRVYAFALLVAMLLVLFATVLDFVPLVPHWLTLTFRLTMVGLVFFILLSGVISDCQDNRAIRRWNARQALLGRRDRKPPL